VRVLVLGIGSVLMGDDAVGPTVARRLLAAYSFPPEVEVQDVGTPGPELAWQVGGIDALIVIDAVKGSGPPGALHLYRRPELLAKPPGNWRLSPHDPGLKEAILSADFAGDGPADVLLVGIVPEKVELGSGLSQPVRNGLPRLEAEVLAELTRLGVAAVARAEPETPDLWWEEPPGAASA